MLISTLTTLNHKMLNYNNICRQIKIILDEILEKLPDAFNMMELMAKVEPADRTPYVVVAFQECERMNMLTGELRYAHPLPRRTQMMHGRRNYNL